MSLKRAFKDTKYRFGHKNHYFTRKIAIFARKVIKFHSKTVILIKILGVRHWKQWKKWKSSSIQMEIHQFQHFQLHYFNLEIMNFHIYMHKSKSAS